MKEILPVFKIAGVLFLLFLNVQSVNGQQYSTPTLSDSARWFNFEKGTVFGENNLGPNEWIQMQQEAMPINMNDFRLAVGYPKSALDSNISEKIVIRIQVSDSGKYLGHIMLNESPHPALAKAVNDNAPMIRFKPSYQNNRPITSWVTIPIHFTLTNSIPYPPPPEIKEKKPKRNKTK
jgi:TonB family protein